MELWSDYTSTNIVYKVLKYDKSQQIYWKNKKKKFPLTWIETGFNTQILPCL